ncbi:MAG: DUF3143 domain-containing protein [Cyanothece sp. SIO1E1]|nr:DUF3143 domain-containing protein [Cyanothece sp. SIO1E1]
MALPPANTPLYNHPLPDIEKWLVTQGCMQDPENLHCWSLQRLDWEAELLLDIDSLLVHYTRVGEDKSDIRRSFKYSLSRGDLEEAIFSGP